MIKAIAGENLKTGQLCYIDEIAEKGKMLFLATDVQKHIPSCQIQQPYIKGDEMLFEIIEGRWFECNKDSIPFVSLMALPPVDEKLQDILNRLSLCISYIRATQGYLLEFLEQNELDLLTTDQQIMALEARRHRILDQLKKPFDPEEAKKLNSTPGIHNFTLKNYK